MIKDKFGIELFKDDYIAYPDSHYTELLIGRIIKITPKTFRL